MNQLSPIRPSLRTLGAPKRDHVKLRFSIDQFYRMAETGLFEGYGKVELIGGEIFVSPSYFAHGNVQKLLYDALHDSVRQSGRTDIAAYFEIMVEREPALAVQPDIMIIEKRPVVAGVPIEQVKLIVEVADASMRGDRGRKKKWYAEAGVPEYWVASLRNYMIERFADVVDGQYTRRDLFVFGDAIESVALPGIGIGPGVLPG